MFSKLQLFCVLICAILLLPVVADDNPKTVLPLKMSSTDLAGDMFKRPDMRPQTHADGHKTESVTSMVSSDGKYYSGMYRSEATRIDITERPYGVNEFMYFLSGSVTLTSIDGSVMTIHAGEAVTLPKEWKGIFETDGYEKIWVIYSDEQACSFTENYQGFRTCANLRELELRRYSRRNQHIEPTTPETFQDFVLPDC